MLSLSNTQIRRAVTLLVGFHIIIICASNYLVQLPFTIWGWHTTWGAFSFPFVYLATDLTVRIFGQVNARQIIFKAMLPALIISYLIGVLFHQGLFKGLSSLAEYNSFVLRIAVASFAAYLFGQLLDIKVFAKLRINKSWWVAPTASTLLGNLLDTLIFFSFAFYASTDSFMAENWFEISMVDYAFKLIVSLFLFLPAYGMLLRALEKRIVKLPEQPAVIL